MQLFAETNLDDAIAELERVIPVAALQNIIESCVAKHQSRGALRRRLELLRALQIVREVAA